MNCLEEDEERSIVDLLPSSHRPRYTESFLRSFFVTLVTVGYKLANPIRPLRFSPAWQKRWPYTF
jgi:hypothetical protein